MGKHKHAPKEGVDAQKDTFPTPSSHRGEAGDTGNAVQDMRDNADSLEERISQMGAIPRHPSDSCSSANHPLNNL